MSLRRPSNPLALAVLTLLDERPMHPYEMSTTLRHRHKEDSIRLNYGSLYAIVGGLQKQGLIEVHDVVREGNRPERTVYAITAVGRAVMVDWLTELVRDPAKEYPQFEAALSLMGILPPETAIDLLDQRLAALEARRAADAELAATFPPHFPRIFLIESEFEAALVDAEIAFVRNLITELREESISGMRIWQRVHELRATDLTREQISAVIDEEFADELRWMEADTT